MSQFAVYRNADPATRSSYPLLLDVQSEVLADLESRVVVPLCPASAMKGKLIRTLMPTFSMEGKQYAMLTNQIAGVSAKQLGAKAGDLSSKRSEIIAALDLLITGF